MKALSPSTSSPLFCWVSLTTKLLLCLCWLSRAYYYYKCQSSQSTGPPKYRKWTPLSVTWGISLWQVFQFTWGCSRLTFFSAEHLPSLSAFSPSLHVLSSLLSFLFSARSCLLSVSPLSLLQPAASSLYHPHPHPCPGLHDTATLTGVEFLFATLSLLPFNFFLTRTFLLVEFLVLPFSLSLFGPRDCMKQKPWP